MSIQSDILPMCCGNSRQAAVITTMAVLPEVQRQGIGTALLEAAQCWAASLGVQVIALFVYRDNYSAIRYHACLNAHHRAHQALSAYIHYDGLWSKRTLTFWCHTSI